MPDDISKQLSKKARQLLTQEGEFRFRLTDYTGKDNKPQSIVYEPDNIIFYG